MSTSSTPPRRVRVTSPRTTARRTRARSVHSEIDAETQLGEVYMRSLVRSQLRLGLSVLAVVGIALGSLPVVGYAPPGSAELAAGVGALVADHPVLLLANHGSVVAADTLERAVDLAEELEAAARLHVTLAVLPHRTLSAAQVAQLRTR